MNTAPLITAADRLGLTVFLAASVHAVLILGLAFSPEDPAQLDAPPSLEVTLVQERSDASPDKADYLAQIDQEGGGESEQRNRPSNPFTSTEVTETAGVAPQPLQGGNPEVAEAEDQPVVTQLHSEDKTIQHEKQTDSEISRKRNNENIDYDLEIARLTAELDLAKEAYAKRPKKMVLTANTKAYLPARYMHQWVEKVERVGNLNYPREAARNKVEGTLMMEVELDVDGSIVEVNLLRSSGNTLLDESARRIVEMAAPYPPFPQPLREKADRLQIVRTWQFSNGGLDTR